jgi:tetratricopeptide (TPR) repeat protein
MRRTLLGLLLVLIVAACGSPQTGDPTSSGQPQADSYLKSAYFHLLTNDPHGALADFDRAIAAAPKYAIAYSGRGRAWMQLRRYDRAVDDFSTAIALGSAHPASAYSSRGGAWAAAGDDERAIEDYGRAIALDSKYWMAYFGRAIVLARLNDNDKALADLDRALALDPGAAETAPDPDPAAASLPSDESPDERPSAGATASSEQSRYYISIIRTVRAQVLIQKGQYEQALVDLDEALRLEPKFADAHVYHGLAQMGLGRCDSGRADLKAAADLGKVSLDRVRDAHRAFIDTTHCGGETL